MHREKDLVSVMWSLLTSMNIIQWIITKAIIILCISTFDHIDIKGKHQHTWWNRIHWRNKAVLYRLWNQNKKIQEAWFSVAGNRTYRTRWFNEPGSHINSGTRIITLDHITRVDASSDFNGTANVPKIAITMGFPLFCCQENCFAGLGAK
jgi:hypothetical protein